MEVGGVGSKGVTIGGDEGVVIATKRDPVQGC